MEGNHGSAGESTMLQSPYEEKAAVACLEFWYTIAHKSTISLFCLDDHLVQRVTRYSMAHNGGVTKLVIKVAKLMQPMSAARALLFSRLEQHS